MNKRIGIKEIFEIFRVIAVSFSTCIRAKTVDFPIHPIHFLRPA